MSCENYIEVSELVEKLSAVTSGDFFIIIDSSDGYKVRLIKAEKFKGIKGDPGVPGVKGDPGVAGPVRVFRYMGEFDDTKTYSLWDVVSFDWIFYISNKDGNIDPVSNTTSWTVLQLLSNSGGTVSTIEDGIAANGTVTINYPDNITITYSDGGEKVFSLDTIEERDKDGFLLTTTSVTGSWNLTNDGIIYTTGPILSVDGNTGNQVAIGSFAKQNQENRFTAKNTFESLTEFKGPVSIGYKRIANDVGVIPFDEANKFKMVFTSTGTKVISGEGIVAGMSWHIVIQVASGVPSISINLDTAIFTGLDPSQEFLSHTDELIEFPMTLTTGSHFFPFEVHEAGIHWWYAGKTLRKV